ncbi:transposase family protein [Xanthomonas theicola]|uniref:transposase family protein n=1 Tax=Xanthomonas theicola TaxID=56464 RepID=UPI00163A18E2|nr:transposase family protein [Xanthomonas theicola]QNH23487.1 hypothetical protein G4Q83_09205 [Xanthomonas theicola]
MIDLEPAPGAQRHCMGCGQTVTAIDDRTMRRIGELPVFGDPVELHVPRLRLACPPVSGACYGWCGRTIVRTGLLPVP